VRRQHHTDVHWWGGYFGHNTPEADDFVICIFGDIGGTPDIDPLNEFAVGAAVDRVDTGIVELLGPNVLAYSVRR
jgi:hypothetical protein